MDGLPQGIQQLDNETILKKGFGWSKIRMTKSWMPSKVMKLVSRFSHFSFHSHQKDSSSPNDCSDKWIFLTRFFLSNSWFNVLEKIILIYEMEKIILIYLYKYVE